MTKKITNPEELELEKKYGSPEKSGVDAYYEYHRKQPRLFHWFMKNGGKKLKYEKVLDIGAGFGNDGFPYLEIGKQVTFVDWQKDPLKVLRKQARKYGFKVKTIVTDAKKMSFKDESFDLIQTTAFPITTEVLTECNRVLKKEGILVSDAFFPGIKLDKVTKNNWWFDKYRGIENLTDLRKNKNKADLYTKKQVENFLREHGFTPIKIYEKQYQKMKSNKKWRPDNKEPKWLPIRGKKLRWYVIAKKVK